MDEFQREIDINLNLEYGTTAEKASAVQLYTAVSKAAMKEILPALHNKNIGKRACYFSAEFLMGRMIYSNLLNMGRLEDCKKYLEEKGVDIGVFEEIEDDALGNGGLGRLAACFLDSAASHDIPLDGYGIRYKYGLFKQYFDNGFQKETADNWLKFGDPWSIRRDDEAVTVNFRDLTVKAVPYDMPVIGYGGKTVNKLRLWQSEPIEEFDFDQFNQQKYNEAVEKKNRAEDISAVLYPNDDTDEGKKLRLKQQYFFSSASLQSIVRDHVKNNGTDFSGFADSYAIQLNDTHPTVAIPELLRILSEIYLLDFDTAFDIVKNTFSYTNHTIMAEALEKWNVSLFNDVLPEVYPYVVMINNKLKRELKEKGISDTDKYLIISWGQIHMARMAIYASHSTNGVARIHSEILKDRVLKDWYDLYPERFNNKTNGITQRRWMKLCNEEMSQFITQRIGDKWTTDLDELKKLVPYASNASDLKQFAEIKLEKKRQLCKYIYEHENFAVFPEFIFDIQVKRLHEYKRQLLNALSILDIYYGIKEGRIKDFYPTAFIFGAKAAPGYYRAKGIIKLINETAKLVNYDSEVNRFMQVLFIQNYNVSYAEKLIPAADISEQISTAGTEASGTGNMKFMLNGAVTMGTLDGANIEIVEQAGEQNNYIFGAKVDEIENIKNSYDPKQYYNNNPRIRKVLDTLIDGTLNDGGSGMFRELYNSILEGASWHKADQYFLLLDFEGYCNARLKANADYKNKEDFARKCFLNMANSGKFSSDRTIKEYAKEIWKV